MTNIDLWADEFKPEVNFDSTVYRVTVPRPSEVTTGTIPFVYVAVDRWGMIQLSEDTYWPDKEGNNGYEWKNHYTLREEIFTWLIEWELVEWKRIGPEDSELFATEFLTGKEPNEL